MDNRRRKAGRRAADSPEDEARYLVELMRSGLSPLRIQLAAYLGDSASQMATDGVASENTSLYHLTRMACVQGAVHFPMVLLTWACSEVAQLWYIIQENVASDLANFWWETVLHCQDYAKSGAYVQLNFNHRLARVIHMAQLLSHDWEVDPHVEAAAVSFDALAQLMHAINYLEDGHAVAAANHLENITSRLETIDDLLGEVEGSSLANMMSSKSIPSLIKLLKDPNVG